MPRRLLRFAAPLLLVAGMLASTPAAVGGELGYGDVNPIDIQTMVYVDAEQAVEKAEAALAGLRPTDDPLVLRRIAQVLSYLCEAHTELGQYEEAEGACLEAVATFDQVAKVDMIAEVENHRLALPRLALVYEALHRHDKALAVLERLLDRVSAIRGDFQAAQLLKQIGDVQLTVGRFREAESAYKEAISRSAEAWSGDGWSVTAIYVNLALLYRLEERLDKAEATLKDGIAESQRAQAERSKGRASTAMEKLQSLAVPILLQWLGWVYYEQGHYVSARDAAQQTLAHLETEGWASGLLTSSLKILLARIEDAERPGSPLAEQYLTSAATLPEEADGWAHLLSAVAESELARHHLLRKDFSKAEPLAREAVDDLTWQLGETHFETARAKARVAEALRGQGKHREALPFALAAYVAQRQVLPPYHSETGETLALLIELYEALDRRKDLAATRELVEAHRAARAKFESSR